MTAVILDWALNIAFAAVGIALLLVVLRFLLGPTPADRVVALDTLVAAAMGLIALVAIRSGFSSFIDIAVVLGLVGFLSTVALARFLLVREAQDAEKPPPAAAAKRQKATGRSTRKLKGNRK